MRHILYIAIVWMALPGGSAAGELRFLAAGDVPYTPLGELAFRGLLAQAVKTAPAFLLHVGDIKSGDSECSDRALGRIRDLFRQQPVPLVYSPGDNDWTDCHRRAAGGYDPLERLQRLRQLFFSDPDVLKLSQLRVDVPDAARPENYSFVRDGVLFVNLHIVGSYNNRRPGNRAAMKEFQARDRVVQGLIKRAFARAGQEALRGIVLIFHADPLFERSRPHPAYKGLLKGLQRELAQWPAPVLAIHGDSHTYRLDHPLRNPRSGKPFPNFTRLQVPGSPLVRLVEVRVIPEGSQLFKIGLFEPEPLEDMGWSKE